MLLQAFHQTGFRLAADRERVADLREDLRLFAAVQSLVQGLQGVAQLFEIGSGLGHQGMGGGSECLLLVEQGSERGREPGGSGTGLQGGKVLLTECVIVAIPGGDGADQHFPRRERTLTRDLGEREGLFGDRSAGHGVEGVRQGGGGGPQGVIRGEHVAAREGTEIHDVAANRGGDGGVALGGR